MNVSLPEPLQKFVQKKITDGEFRTVDEVVCEALRLFQNHEAWNARASEAIEAGWAQASAGQLQTPEQVRENLTSRKAAWKQQHGK
jgi:putative addiction module CopG family antidote